MVTRQKQKGQVSRKEEQMGSRAPQKEREAWGRQQGQGGGRGFWGFCSRCQFPHTGQQHGPSQQHLSRACLPSKQACSRTGLERARGSTPSFLLHSFTICSLPKPSSRPQSPEKRATKPKTLRPIFNSNLPADSGSPSPGSSRSVGMPAVSGVSPPCRQPC